MAKFIDIVFEKSNEHDPGSTAIVFPSQRAISYFKKRCAKENKAMLLPELLTMERLAERISCLEEEDDLFMASIVHNRFGKELNREFASFLLIFPQIISDFNDIDMYLKDAALLRNIREISKIGKMDAESIEERYFDLMEKMVEIYNFLNEELEKRQSGYRGRVYRRASEKAKEYDEFENVIFAGFNIFTPSEARIIDFLAERKKAKLLFNIPKILFESGHESSEHIREYVNRWKNESERFDCSENERIAIYGYSLSSEQPNALSKEIEGSSAAIVLCDESLMLPAVNCIPEKVKEINVTMGYPLSMMPHFFLLRRIFETHKTADGKFFGKREIVNLIESMRENSIGGKGSFEILKNLNEINDPFVDIEKMISKVDEEEKTLIELALNWYDERNELIMPEKVLKKIRTFFEIAGKSEDRGRTEEGQRGNYIKSSAATIITEINKVITLMSEGLIKTGNNRLEVETILFSLLSGKRVPFSGDPMVDFQVMGMLETRCLQFDKTVIMSVNEGVMPKGKNYASFIPYDVRRETGLPGYEQNDKLFSYYFYTLLLNSKESIVTYSHSQSDSTDEKSRFVEQMLWERRKGGVFEDKKIEIHSPEYRVSSPSSMEKIEKSDNVMNLLNKVTFSASSISKFINCPVDFYFQNLLKIPDVNDEDDLGADVIGTAAHRALNEFYFLKMNEKIISREMSINSDRIKQSISNSFKEKGFSNISKGKPYLMAEATARMTERFLSSDIKRMEECGRLIVGLEKTLFADFPFEGRKIALKGTIDRIEHDSESKEIRIMDYKSGSAKDDDVRIKDRQNLIIVQEWLEAENDSWSKVFQLLFYGYLIRHGADKDGKKVGEADGKRIRLGIYPLRNPKRDLMLFTTPDRGEREVFDYDTAADERFGAILCEIIGLMFDNSKPFKKKNSEKLYCKW
ncbi:MAG: PD-(D/E)XK nuclease family protein [bacterium]|nr:PD-(D/E)XK nuclease family protein [bacterium]